MAVEGHAAITRAGNRPVAIATMDDELHYLDLSPFANLWTYVRSSLREAGQAVIEELIRQCEKGGPGGTLIPSTFHVVSGLDDSVLNQPLPKHRL
jgi:LacI family transcriptional regulator